MLPRRRRRVRMSASIEAKEEEEGREELAAARQARLIARVGEKREG
jgi:hypothetical protein